MGNFWDDVRKDAAEMARREVVDRILRNQFDISDKDIAKATKVDLEYVISRRKEIEEEIREAKEKEAEEQRIKDELKKEAIEAKIEEIADNQLRKGKYSDEEIAEFLGVGLDYVLSRRKAIL